MKRHIPLVIRKLLPIGFPFLLITWTVVVLSVSGQQFATPPIPVEQRPYLKDYATPTDTIRAGFVPRKAKRWIAFAFSARTAMLAQ
jgi:hypothetical protein